jgi:ABC-type Na+ efflux pump permease subunit
MTTLRHVWAIFRKEVLDGSRDRRSISSLVFSALISPILFGLMFTVAAERGKSADEIALPVDGAQYAPALVEWLGQQSGVTVVPPPADAEKAVSSRDEDVVLIIDKDFAKNMGRAVPAQVKLVSDVTRDSARPKVTRVRNPVPRGALAAGKWLAASLFGCCAVLFSMLLTINVMRRVPWHDLGIRFRVSDAELMSLLVLILPLALFLSAIVMFASTFARSFKEAQSYLGMLMLLPMLPGLVSTMYPLAGRPWMAPIPVLGQYALAADVLGGKPPGVAFYLLAGMSVVACAIGLVTLTARMLEREAIVFGR